MGLKSKQSQIVGLIAWFIVSFAVSAVGALASIQAKSFYAQLTQPMWAPPGHRRLVGLA
jgi:tryptophan-rich sensory protein